MSHARILLDSISPAGIRLTTLEVEFHRFVLAEFNTHRALSRNAASSRAIPTAKTIAAVETDPALPIMWGKNQSGMSARHELHPDAQARAHAIWNAALARAIADARALSEPDIDLHKQLVNRLLEPFSWVTLIVSATSYDNFFLQRLHPDAQPEIQHAARLMQHAIWTSQPTPLAHGDWHTPLIQPDEAHLDIEIKKRVSVARCARVSYLTHDNIRSVTADLDLYNRLVNGGANGHWSPFEHIATPGNAQTQSGNFHGWHQFRKSFPNEDASRPVAENAST